MLRRQARLRREYIFKKTLQHRVAQTAERKLLMKQCLEQQQMIPKALRDEALELQQRAKYDDEEDIDAKEEDDEYHWAGVSDPKIVVSTSRDPSAKLKQFAKEMKLILPNSQRINRGNYESKQLVDACRANEVTDLVVVHETRGVPDSIVVSHLPFGPTAFFTLHNCVMRHDIKDVGTMSEAYPHLIFHNLTTKLGGRVTNIMKYLFPVPKDDSKRIMSFVNNDDFISFRHHVYEKIDKQVQLKEVGPRFELQLYKIVQGTLENVETSEIEWVYRPFMNTSRKRKFLSLD